MGNSLTFLNPKLPLNQVHNLFKQSSVFSQLSDMFQPSSRSEVDVHKPAIIGGIHFHFTVEYRRYKSKLTFIWKYILS
jgi:hypothetical protein